MDRFYKLKLIFCVGCLTVFSSNKGIERVSIFDLSYSHCPLCSGLNLHVIESSVLIYLKCKTK